MSCLTNLIDSFESGNINHLNSYGLYSGDNGTLNGNWKVEDNELFITPPSTKSYYDVYLGCVSIPCEMQGLYYIVSNDDNPDATVTIEVDYSPKSCDNISSGVISRASKTVQVFSWPLPVFLPDFQAESSIKFVSHIRFTNFSVASSEYTISPISFTQSQSIFIPIENDTDD